MKVVVYIENNSNVPSMVICVKDGSEGIDIVGYNKYVVEPENILNSANLPINFDTFMLNFDKFVFNGSDTLRQNTSLALDNRKINELSKTTGMAIGRSNSTELFNVL